MTATTDTPTTTPEVPAKLTAPEWLNLATLVSMNTRDKIEMAVESLDEMLLDELGILIATSVRAIEDLDDELGQKDLPDDVFQLVRQVVGAERLTDLWTLVMEAVGVNGSPTSDYLGELWIKYPEHLKRMGVRS